MSEGTKILAGIGVIVAISVAGVAGFIIGKNSISFDDSNNRFESYANNEVTTVSSTESITLTEPETTVGETMMEFEQAEEMSVVEETLAIAETEEVEETTVDSVHVDGYTKAPDEEFAEDLAWDILNMWPGEAKLMLPINASMYPLGKGYILNLRGKEDGWYSLIIDSNFEYYGAYAEGMESITEEVINFVLDGADIQGDITTYLSQLHY